MLLEPHHVELFFATPDARVLRDPVHPGRSVKQKG